MQDAQLLLRGERAAPRTIRKLGIGRRWCRHDSRLPAFRRAGASGGQRLRIPVGHDRETFSDALKGKLPGGVCLTIIGTEGWLPDRRITIVGDSSFATLELIAAVRRHVRLITRLRLDANLFAPAPPRRPGQRGRWALKGKRLPNAQRRAGDPATVWTKLQVTDW